MKTIVLEMKNNYYGMHDCIGKDWPKICFGFWIMQRQRLGSNCSNRFAISGAKVKWAAQWALKMASEKGQTASCRISDKINVDQVMICLFLRG